MKKIIPIIAIVLLSMMSCHRQKNNAEKVDIIETGDDINWNDSFIVVYRQYVNGYRVKAVVKPGVSDVPVMKADLSFEKKGKAFTLYTSCFGDTLFCKGRVDYESENLKTFKMYKNKTISADYHVNIEEGHMMPKNTPFFFMDLDFDNVDELVIVHHSMAVRYHDGYDVYRIVDGKPVLIDYPPYRTDDDFGMTDFPEFDYKKQTITCPYPEGGLSYLGRIIYGVSQKQKDIVDVNGRKHYFNHLEPIKEIKYEE